MIGAKCRRRRIRHSWNLPLQLIPPARDESGPLLHNEQLPREHDSVYAYGEFMFERRRTVVIWPCSHSWLKNLGPSAQR